MDPSTFRTEMLLSWSTNLSTLHSNTVLLSRMVEKGAVTDDDSTVPEAASQQPEQSQKQRAAAMFSTLNEQRSSVNLHLRYMLIRPDIREASIEFRAAVLSAHSQNLLTDTVRIILAGEFPELLEELIQRSAAVFEKHSALSVFTATSYPELLVENLKSVNTSTLLAAVRTMLRSPHPPQLMDDEEVARRIVAEIKRRPITNKGDMDNWIDALAPLVVRAYGVPETMPPVALREMAHDPHQARAAMIASGRWHFSEFHHKNVIDILEGAAKPETQAELQSARP
jgi:hypothetical protein